MSTLLILLPVDHRNESADYPYWFSPDDRPPGPPARAALAALPRADRVLALLPDERLSWLPVQLPPRLKGARLRAALAGLLEEQLLEDPEQLHLALLDGGDAGSWAAATAAAPLRAQLQRLEEAGLTVDALLPLSWPQALAGGHIGLDAERRPWLRAWGPHGLASLPLEQARQWLEADWLAQARLQASPEAVQAAEQWLGRPVPLQSEAERVWAAHQQGPNLLQFDFAPTQRGWRRLHKAWLALQQPEWRPLRWGLVALLLVQVLGLNLQAWQQQRAIAQRQAEQDQLLLQAFPQLRVVRDAPLQMQRETEALRSAAGQPGPADLEGLLARVARAWPSGQTQGLPLAGLRFEDGRLQLSGLPAAQLAALRERLQAEGGLLVQEDAGVLRVAVGDTRGEGRGDPRAGMRGERHGEGPQRDRRPDTQGETR